MRGDEIELGKEMRKSNSFSAVLPRGGMKGRMLEVRFDSEREIRLSVE